MGVQANEPKVFLLELPAEFNFELVRQGFAIQSALERQGQAPENSISNPAANMEALYHYALGPAFEDGRPGFFHTHQFCLEMLVHHRLLNSPQRVASVDEADVAWVPYYASFAAFFAVPPHVKGADRFAIVAGREQRLLDWLDAHAPGYHTQRRKYALAVATVMHQFLVPPMQGWGSNLLADPRLANVTVASIESQPGCQDLCIAGQPGETCGTRCHLHGGHVDHDLSQAYIVGVPYPSFYHILNDDHTPPEHRPWRRRPPGQLARYLASFVGASQHGEVLMPLRASLMQQCVRAPGVCAVLSARGTRADTFAIEAAYSDSVFCLQPPGDTATRRGIFDAVMCGCIPVVFSPDQLGGATRATDSGTTDELLPLQYEFHLPHPEEVAVLVPPNRHGDTLQFLSDVVDDHARLARLQTAMQTVAPTLQYSHPKRPCIGTGTCPDALDVLFSGIVQRNAAAQAQAGGGGAEVDVDGGASVMV